MAGGRPLKYSSVEELKSLIDKYFNDCDPHMEEITEWVQARDSKGNLKKDENGLNYLVQVTHKVMTKQKHYTITGLALAIGTNRTTLVNYEAKDEFIDTIKEAKNKVEAYWENLLVEGNATGTIFNLKNNYGWKDKTEQELSNPDGSLNPMNALTVEELRKLANGSTTSTD